MIAAAPAWAVWTAVGLGVTNVVVWAGVVVGTRALVAQYKRQYGPLLSALFGAATIEASAGEPQSPADTPRPRSFDR